MINSTRVLRSYQLGTISGELDQTWVHVPRIDRVGSPGHTSLLGRWNSDPTHLIGRDHGGARGSDHGEGKMVQLLCANWLSWLNQLNMVWIMLNLRFDFCCLDWQRNQWWMNLRSAEFMCWKCNVFFVAFLAQVLDWGYAEATVQTVPCQLVKQRSPKYGEDKIYHPEWHEDRLGTAG